MERQGLSRFQHSNHTWDPPGEDSDSFALCIIAKLLRSKNTNRLFTELLSVPLEGVTVPDMFKTAEYSCFKTEDKVFLSAVSKERSCNVNVFGYINSSRKIHSIIVNAGQAKKTESLTTVNLLRLHTSATSVRYLLIGDLDRFLSLQTRCNGYAKSDKRSHCPYCLSGFWSARVRDDHLSFCRAAKHNQKESMPKRDDDGGAPTLSFRNHYRKVPPPIAIYYDMEAALPSIASESEQSLCEFCAGNGSLRGVSCRCNTDFGSHTTPTHLHRAISYSFVAVDYKGEVLFDEFDTCSEENAGKKFLEHLLAIKDDIKEYLTRNVPIRMTRADEIDFQSATVCYLCDEPFTDRDLPVKDHQHYDGTVSVQMK